MVVIWCALFSYGFNRAFVVFRVPCTGLFVVGFLMCLSPHKFGCTMVVFRVPCAGSVGLLFIVNGRHLIFLFPHGLILVWLC